MKTLMLIVLLFANLAIAAPSLVYHGRILKPNGDPVTSSTVIFKTQIRSPGAENCLLYEETQTLDLSSTNGVFVLTFSGSGSTRTDSSGYSFQNIFSNRATFTLAAGQCSSGTTYVPVSTDARKISISFDDSSGNGWEPFPTQTLAYSPMAIEALQVGGFTSSSLLRVANGSGPQTATALTPANFTELLALINGTTTQYLKSTDNAAGFTGSLAGDVTGTQGATVVAKIQGVAVSSTAPTNGQVLTYNGTSWAPAAATGGGNGTVTAVTSANSYLSVATGTSTPALTLNVGTTANTVAAGDDSRIVNALQPNTTIGGSTAINTSGNLVTTGTVSGATVSGTSIRAYNGANYVQLSAPALSGNVLFSLPSADGTSGQVLKTNGSGALSWYSLPSVVDWSVTGAELIHPDRLSLGAGNASKVVTTSGAGAIVASTITSTELGYLSGVTSAIQTQLNAKQATIDKTTALSISSAKIYGSNANNYVMLTSPALSGNTTYNLPTGDGTAGQVLKTDGAGSLSWYTLPSAPVTSVNGSTGAVVLSTTNISEGTNLYHTDARTIASVLTGVDVTTAGTISATDTVLSAFGKAQKQIDSKQDLVTKSTALSVSTAKIYGSNANNYVMLTVPALAANTTYSWPSAYPGTSGYVLASDTSGNLSWQNSFGTGVTATTTEINYLSGVTSAIQTQLNAKAALSGATFTGSVTATAFYYSSDRRLKKDINTIESALDKVLDLRGVTFNWKKDNKPEVGFIAQEVEQVMPELVQTANPGKADEMKSVKYGNIVAVVVEALKEFYQQWFRAQKNNEEQIAILQKKNIELEQKYIELSQEIEKLKTNQRSPASENK